MRSVAGFFLSMTLHAGLVAWGYLYFPTAFSNLAQTVIVPVELVSIAETTNIRAARPEPEPVEEDPEPELPDIEPDPVLPEPEPEIVPEPVASEPEAIPEDPRDDPEVVEDVVEEVEEIVPEPTPEPEPEEPQGLNLDRLGDLVERSREQAPQNADTGAFRNAVGSGEDMTASLSTILSSQIAQCNRTMADAPADMELGVIVEVRLQRDGTLDGAPRLKDAGRINNSSNPYLRVAGQRALRAVINCAPYRLPSENYQQWRLLEVAIRPPNP